MDAPDRGGHEVSLVQGEIENHGTIPLISCSGFLLAKARQHVATPPRSGAVRFGLGLRADIDVQFDLFICPPAPLHRNGVSTLYEVTVETSRNQPQRCEFHFWI